MQYLEKTRLNLLAMMSSPKYNKLINGMPRDVPFFVRADERPVWHKKVSQHWPLIIRALVARMDSER